MNHVNPTNNINIIYELWKNIPLMLKNQTEELEGMIIKCSSRNSRPEVYYRKDVPENFLKFTGKHRSLFFNKVAGIGYFQLFSCEFCQISKSTFFI